MNSICVRAHTLCVIMDVGDSLYATYVHSYPK